MSDPSLVRFLVSHPNGGDARSAPGDLLVEVLLLVPALEAVTEHSPDLGAWIAQITPTEVGLHGLHGLIVIEVTPRFCHLCRLDEPHRDETLEQLAGNPGTLQQIPWLEKGWLR